MVKVIKDNRPFLKIKRKRKILSRRRRNFFFKIKKNIIYNSNVFVKYPNWYYRWKILPVKYKTRKYKFKFIKKVILGNRPIKTFLKKFKWKLKKNNYNRNILHWKYRRLKKRLKFINNFNRKSLPLYYFVNNLKIKKPRLSLKMVSKKLEESKKKYFFKKNIKGYQGKNFIPNFKYKKIFPVKETSKKNLKKKYT